MSSLSNMGTIDKNLPIFLIEIGTKKTKLLF
jgi:hypothetical protein